MSITPEPVEASPAPKQSRSLNNRLPVALAGIAFVGIVVAFAIESGDSEDSVSLSEAVEVIDSPYITVEDDGTTIIIDGDGEESPGASVEDIALTLLALDTPDSVVVLMDSTRAIDGMQDATWGDYAASWNYHPDYGLDVVITQF